MLVLLVECHPGYVFNLLLVTQSDVFNDNMISCVVDVFSIYTMKL